MTVANVRRSQSMWSMSSRKYSVSNSSPSNSFGSSWSLNESPRGIAKKFKRTGGKKCIQTTRITCAPCVSGDVNAVDSQGRSLLFYAARYGQVDPALQLIQAGCFVNQTDEHGNTPLHEAIERGNIEMAKVLLKEGCVDVNICGKNGETPLMIAVSRGQLDAIRLLHKYGADVNKCDTMGRTPLYRALKRGWSEVADFLLDQQCNVNTTPSNGMTCFFAASHCNKLQPEAIARRLLKTDYDFQKDSEWILTEGCPPSIQADSKMHDKILSRAGLKTLSKRRSFIRSGTQKILKTFRSMSN